jgi:hypothetical protein
MTEEPFHSSAWTTSIIERSSRNNTASGLPKRGSRRRRQKPRLLRMLLRPQRKSLKRMKVDHQHKRVVTILRLKKRTH